MNKLNIFKYISHTEVYYDSQCNIKNHIHLDIMFLYISYIDSMSLRFNDHAIYITDDNPIKDTVKGLINSEDENLDEYYYNRLLTLLDNFESELNMLLLKLINEGMVNKQKSAKSI